MLRLIIDIVEECKKTVTYDISDSSFLKAVRVEFMIFSVTSVIVTQGNITLGLFR